MTRQKNGTWRLPSFPTAIQSDNGPLGLHRLMTRNVSTFRKRGCSGLGQRIPARNQSVWYGPRRTGLWAKAEL